MRHILLTALLLLIAAQPSSQPSLRQMQDIPLPHTEGRFDHSAFDAKHHRLYIAALGNDTVEVIDTDKAQRIHTITGPKKPCGVAVVPDSNQIAVSSADDGMCRFFDADSWKLLAAIDNLDDADNARFDPQTGHVFIGYGSGALAEIDRAKHQKIRDVKLDAHPESFQLESTGSRIFVNVPEAGHIAVIDRNKGDVIAKWPVNQARANFPMALDERDHRLFIGCRNPARLLVYDTESGKPVAQVDCVGDTDDLFYDSATHQILITGGQGAITIVQQDSPDAYHPIATIPTAPGARTSFYIEQTQTLYVAVPHRGEQQAELRVFAE